MNIISKKISDIVRYLVKKYLTGNLGKVIEEDDKLICYVKKRKCIKGKDDYYIFCCGTVDKDKALAREYELDKPICYVIDGLKFEREVHILSDNCDFIIKNCKFSSGISIDINGKCTLKNTFIKSPNSLPNFSLPNLNYTNYNLLQLLAKDLIIENMDISNELKDSFDLHIQLGADGRLEIINSSIGKVGERTSVFLSGFLRPFFIEGNNEINLVNSKVAGDEVTCGAKKIISDEKSLITASEEVTLKTDYFEKINVETPRIVYNENTFFNRDGVVALKKVVDPLKIKRLELIELLRKIKCECEKANKDKNDYNNQSVGKILKRVK